MIGRTPRQLIDLDRDSLIPYAPGDTFRFFPISASEWTGYRGGLVGKVDTAGLVGKVDTAGLVGKVDTEHLA